MICCSRTYSHPQKKEGSFSGREDLVIRMSSLEWTHWCPAVQMGPYDRDTLSFRDNCSQWGSCRRSKESCLYHTSYDLFLFVDQNNKKKNILKRGNFAVVDFKLSIKQKREHGILIFSQKNLTFLSNVQKKGGKIVIHNHNLLSKDKFERGIQWTVTPNGTSYIWMRKDGGQIYVWCIQMRPNRWS